ncbi:four helix bundle protein [Antarcticibacterium sp. 1MA-6-2]|uniref:four helix bundle protein n=1 Tax=Antarcticibacterium sp. 1MA-6-2 TaxID=2908210 RepID=UPI001F40665E|nr:four helix bundle protein [Antarcticibacterium sp. 1MA-6-2]UJH90259.1 four helix bundle protein [Antarcticibacterium sp. 1MA-6-2]
MAKIQNFEDPGIYQVARIKCKNVRNLIASAPLERDYKLRDQINRTSMDNIAEGFGRGGNKELIQFLGFSVVQILKPGSH